MALLFLVSTNKNIYAYDQIKFIYIARVSN